MRRNVARNGGSGARAAQRELVDDGELNERVKRVDWRIL